MNIGREGYIYVRSKSGRMLRIPKSQAKAYQEGQEAMERGEKPKRKEQLTQEILAKLLGEDD